MSHEGGPEQPQRTVAELLAKYGAESGERPRRRRRRADDPSDTGAQQIIDRVLSESGEMQAIRDDMPPPERTSHRRGADYQRQQSEPPRRRQQPGQQTGQQPMPQPGQQSSQQLPRPLPPQPSQRLPRPQAGPGPGQQTSNQMPGIGQSGPTTPVRGTPRPAPPQPSQQLPRPQPSQRMPMPPPPGGTRDRSGIQPSIRSRLDGDGPPAPPPPPPMGGLSTETTEELPKVPGRVPVDGSMAGRRPGPGVDSRTRITPPVYPRDPYADPPSEETDYRPGGYPESDPDERYDSAEYDNLLDTGDRRRGFDDGDLDDLDELEGDDLDEDRESSPAREWLIMIGQLALGVIGGAGVWLGFNWLWGFLPAAALAAAVVVIVVLVLIVRKIRRAEDLQTTVLAVLVGLVVTVSPAALLLLNR